MTRICHWLLRARDTTLHSPRMMKMNQTRVGDDSQREPEQRFYHPPEFRVHTVEDNANRLAFTEQKG
jgi:hypothetical protein